MSASFVRFQFEDDHDGTGFLTVDGRFGSFAGKGRACFSIHELEAFAAQIGAYPISTSPRPEVKGGFYSKANDGTLAQELVGLAVYPINLRGDLAIQLRVMTEWWDGDRPESQCRAAFEVPVSYEALRTLSSELPRLARGEVDEVRVESTAG